MMKSKDFVVRRLERAQQIAETIKKGMDSHNITVKDAYRMNLELIQVLNELQDRVSLE